MQGQRFGHFTLPLVNTFTKNAIRFYYKINKKIFFKGLSLSNAESDADFWAIENVAKKIVRKKLDAENLHTACFHLSFDNIYRLYYLIKNFFNFSKTSVKFCVFISY